MRILLLSDVSAEQVLGGAERMLSHHLRALVEAGHDVTLLTRQPNPGEPLSIVVGDDIVEQRLPWCGDRGWRGLKRLKRSAEAWWREYGEDFDVVVAEQPFTAWALIWAGCRLPRLQICYSFAFEEYLTRHASRWSIRDRLAAAAMRRLEGEVYRSATSLLVLSRYTERRFAEAFGIDAGRITVTPGGVEMPEAPEFSREQLRDLLGWKGPVVLTLRNLVPRTGVDLVVEAAGLLKDELPQLRWCVIGQGAMLAQLKAQAARLGVADRIEFTGYLPEDGVRKRLFAADLFMLPTRDLEGFGLVTIEANACGLPVVATPVTANLEVVPSLPYNRLTGAVTSEALADAVREALESPLDDAKRRELQQVAEAKYAWHHHDAALLAAVEALA